ncbi:hypothetical protein [Bacillus sp. 3255]|uniref:hypothetical protein n=1 Tax=Bacillus sp. 3255 TaxID=2817904 RepID=UPI002856085E|nr:hypothetical protein [Bacillus sp. 3255]MDR6879867.1 hypothetical protein [Bacillus sp. 3255]
MAILFSIVLWLFGLFILYLVIQSAIDNSRMKSELTEIKTILQEIQKQGFKQAHPFIQQEVRAVSEKNDREAAESYMETCPACRCEITENDKFCPACELKLRD